MNEVESYFQDVAPRGSSLYYSLLKVASPKREMILAINAFYKVLHDMRLAAREPEVAKAKWQWWRQEISRLNSGRASHPLVIYLQEQLPLYNLDAQAFLDLIDAMETYLHEMISLSDVVLQAERTVGLRDAMIAKLLMPNQAVPDAITKMAVSVEWITQLQNLHAYVQQGWIIFTEEELTAHGVKSEAFSLFRTTAPIRALLKARGEKAKVLQGEAYASLNKADRKVYLPLILRSRLSEAMLHEIALSDYAVLEQHIRLTPLRTLFLTAKMLAANLIQI